MSAAYAVDLDQLDATVASLDGVDERLAQLLDDLHARVSALDPIWSGLSADAHAAAHQAWESGFAEMREALVAMRQAARTAHVNYATAARLNTSLWEQLR